MYTQDIIHSSHQSRIGQSNSLPVQRCGMEIHEPPGRSDVSNRASSLGCIAVHYSSLSREGCRTRE
jgi:hypothetical protein